MKWSILINVPVDNINDFLNQYVVNGAVTVRNEFVKGIMVCEEEADEKI